MIYCDHCVFTWIYKIYKSIIAVETDDILMNPQNRFCFDVLTQKFDTLFDYTFQEDDKLKILSITVIKSKYDIIIDKKKYIIKRIIQEYWGTKKNEDIKIQKSPFTTNK